MSPTGRHGAGTSRPDAAYSGLGRCPCRPGRSPRPRSAWWRAAVRYPRRPAHPRAPESVPLRPPAPRAQDDADQSERATGGAARAGGMKQRQQQVVLADPVAVQRLGLVKGCLEHLEDLPGTFADGGVPAPGCTGPRSGWAATHASIAVRRQSRLPAALGSPGGSQAWRRRARRAGHGGADRAAACDS
jgi:hypothetical protein